MLRARAAQNLQVHSGLKADLSCAWNICGSTPTKIENGFETGALMFLEKGFCELFYGPLLRSET
ncbi:hypothetical protein TR2A62_1772 [Thalassobium sp. R2A62]|nr:hypothetical protein TR2A62_1772 [Thalassobium sp. R2A62]